MNRHCGLRSLEKIRVVRPKRREPRLPWWAMVVLCIAAIVLVGITVN